MADKNKTKMAAKLLSSTPISAMNCLSRCIFAKDMTVQQRDQNKKRRAEKIKQQKPLKEKKNSGQ